MNYRQSYTLINITHTLIDDKHILYCAKVRLRSRNAFQNFYVKSYHS